MIVSAVFLNNGGPVTGLSPIIRIRNVATGALVVNSADMTEIGDGFYTYDFSEIVAGVSYTVLCDSLTLPVAERYAVGDIEPVLSVDGLTIEQALTQMNSVLAGNAVGLDSTTPIFYGQDGTTTRIRATQSNGNRTITERNL